MTAAKTPKGADVFDAISERLMSLGAPINALIPHLEALPAQHEFARFVEAWCGMVRAWDDYLSADLRATLTRPESMSQRNKGDGKKPS